MDAFFASVEQRDNPKLRGCPVAVGGSSQRGVVAAASYEARKYGVHSAMPSSIAARKCPQLVFVKPRFDVYKEVSEKIRDIFYEYTDLVEPLSLDEAYLDVTSNKKDMPSATIIAQEIKKRVKEKIQLTASAGISFNKFLAKTASDIDKPDGLTLIAPNRAQSFVDRLPIEKFFGVGKVTAKKMRLLGIIDGKTLKQWGQEALVHRFGKAGRYYYNIARCIDHRPINPNRIRKSIGAEHTYGQDLGSVEELRSAYQEIIDTLLRRMSVSKTKGKTLTIKVKYTDFTQITRSKTVGYWIDNKTKISELVEVLLPTIDISIMQVRLLGLSISNLNHEIKGPYQLTLEF